jgi:hypothetical protein
MPGPNDSFREGPHQLVQRRIRLVPVMGDPELVDRRIDPPEKTELPAQVLPDAPEDPGDGLLQRRGLREDLGDLVLDLLPLLPLPPLRDVRGDERRAHDLVIDLHRADPRDVPRRAAVRTQRERLVGRRLPFLEGVLQGGVDLGDTVGRNVLLHPGPRTPRGACR